MEDLLDDDRDARTDPQMEAYHDEASHGEAYHGEAYHGEAYHVQACDEASAEASAEAFGEASGVPWGAAEETHGAFRALVGLHDG